MIISAEAVIELLLQVASAKNDDTAEHVLMAVKRMELTSSQSEFLLGAIADGLGVSLG